MVRNIKWFIFILFFLIIFIFINSCIVNANGLDTTSPSSYTKGTKFKLNKDAYNYVIKEVLWYKEAKKEPEDEYIFKKGEIVEYTGEYETDVKFISGKGLGRATYYFRVKKGTKQGLISSEDLEVYKSTRPNTIVNFINENGVDKIKEEIDLNKKVQELVNEANEVGYEDMSAVLSYVDEKIQAIKISGVTREEKKKEIEKEYNEVKKTPAAGDGDYAFLAQAYKLASYYQELLIEDEEYGKDDSKEEDWTKKFDKAYKNYQKAGDDDKKRNAAFEVMSTAMSKMTNEEKEEKVDGKKRNEKFEEIFEEETKRKEASEDTKSEIYKQPKKTSSGSSSKESLDDMISDADSFVQKGSLKYDAKEMQAASQTIYNIVLTIGMFATVIVGGVLGIKLLTGGVEEKADYKKMLLIYLIGCIVIFGGFAAWKIIVNIMQNVWG